MLRLLSERWGFVGVPAAVLVALTLSRIAGQPTSFQCGLLAFGIVLFCVAFPRAPRLVVAPAAPYIASRRRVLSGGVLVLCGLALAAVAAQSGYSSYDNLFNGGFWQYVVGGSMTVVGLAVATTHFDARTLPRVRAGLAAHTPEVACAGLLLLIGLGLRLFRITYFPPALGWPITDEPQIGLAAIGIMKHGGHAWQYPELVYTAIVSIKLFGVSMAALRYPDALASFIGLGAFYCFARMYFRWEVAAAGTGLLAVSHWDLAYSRIVIPATWMMVYELIIFLLAVRAVRGKGSYLAYCAMGILTGMGSYSHASFRLVPLLLVVWALGWLVMQKKASAALLGRHLLGWALYVVCALLTALPYIAIARADTTMAFSERFTSIMPVLFDRSSISDPGSLMQGHLQNLVNFFVGSGDPWAAVNPPNTPMLDVWTGTLFLLGLGYALAHCRRPHYLMWVAWLGITLITGGILTSDFAPERFIGALPVVFLLACIPLQLAYDALTSQSHRGRIKWGAGLGLVAVLCIAGQSNLETYFVSLPNSHDFKFVYDNPATDLVTYFGPRSLNSYNFLLSDQTFPAAGSDYGWLANEPAGRNAADLGDLLPIHDAITESRVDVMLGASYPPAEMAQAVRQIYPSGHGQNWMVPLTGQHYSAVTISSADIAATQDLAGPCASLDTCSPSAHSPAQAVWPGHAFWTGSIYIPQTGQYRLWLPQSQGVESVLRIENQSSTGGLSLLSGWYTLSVEVGGASATAMPRIAWLGPGVSGTVPANYLRKSPAHGMILQFVDEHQPGAELVEPSRVPFPYFMFSLPHNNGRPLTQDWAYPFRAWLTGVVAPGHAGTYRVAVHSYGGQVSVFLDGRPVGLPVEGPSVTSSDQPAAESQFRLRLNGRRQVLQIQYETASTQPQLSSLGLFQVQQDGTDTFLPWGWFTAPAGQTLPSWIAG